MFTHSKFLNASLSLVVVALGASAAAQTSSPQPNGELLFRQRCAACHTVVPGRPSMTGPNLAGVAGRKAGTAAFAYSPALKASNLTWNRANLDRFLTAPARMVPGTRMVISVTNPAQRAAIIQYLSRPTR